MARRRTHGWSIALWCYAGAFYSVLYGPLFAIVAFSVNDSEVTGLPWRGFTLRWYKEILSQPDLLKALFNSFSVGLLAAGISTALAFLLALAFRRGFAGQSIALNLVLLPVLMPGILGGIVLLIFFGYLGIRPYLYTTVLVAHINWVLPFAFLTLWPRIQRFDRGLEEAAMDLGARPVMVLRYVVLPIVQPALVATFLFSFSLSFDEFIRTLFVSGFDRTIPVTFWSTIVDRLAPELPAMAVVIIAISTLGSLLGALFSARASKKSQT